MDFILDGLSTALALLAGLDPETFSAVRATLATTFLAISTALTLGIPLGFCLGFFDFPGKRAARAVADTALALPTVVIGLIVFAFLSQRGPLGHLELLFSISGMAVGLAILGLPIVITMTATTVEGIDRRLTETLLTLGANRRQLAMASLWEARFPVMLSALTAFGRIVSEVGIAMMVGGNIKWHTRTITTAIAMETGKGEFAMGIALGIVLMSIAFLVTLSAHWIKRRAAP
jgi:tungstate transport system permease protein